MRGPRYRHVMATTALVLILANPSAPPAQERDRWGPQPSAAAGPMASPVAVPAAPGVAAEPGTSDPLAALDPADRLVAEKVRDLLAAKGDRIFSIKKERSAVEAFYQGRNLAPLWLDKGIENARARSAIARLK